MSVFSLPPCLLPSLPTPYLTPPAYFKFLLTYQEILKMDTPSFNAFLAPTNHLARILLVHFLAMELMMEPIVSREFGNRPRPIPSRYHLDWIFSARRELPNELRGFVRWPEETASQFGSVKEVEGHG